jgi:hypothetical protein
MIREYCIIKAIKNHHGSAIINDVLCLREKQIGINKQKALEFAKMTLKKFLEIEDTCSGTGKFCRFEENKCRFQKNKCH